jgi:hypothetical protein
LDCGLAILNFFLERLAAGLEFLHFLLAYFGRQNGCLVLQRLNIGLKLFIVRREVGFHLLRQAFDLRIHAFADIGLAQNRTAIKEQNDAAGAGPVAAAAGAAGFGSTG